MKKELLITSSFCLANIIYLNNRFVVVIRVCVNLMIRDIHMIEFVFFCDLVVNRQLCLDPWLSIYIFSHDYNMQLNF
jgi:hypothetical protein